MFIGGSVVGLLVTDQAAPIPRATKDVDLVVEEVTTTIAYLRFVDELQRLDFRSDQEAGAPLCRYVIDGHKLDVVPSDPAAIGFANRWAAAGIPFAERHRFAASGIEIRHISAPFFIASKLEAFRDPHRAGHGDLFGSHDVEDIIAVIDGRPTIVTDVAAASAELRAFLAIELARWRVFDLAPQAHLPPDVASQARVPIVIDRLRAIAAGGRA